MKIHNRLIRKPLRATFCAALIAVAGSASAAPTYGLLYTFNINSLANGAYPKSGLISDSSGNLYGTTQYGGTGTACSDRCGTVFKLAPNGSLTVLHNFTGGVSDGTHPASGLVADKSGNLYGTAAGGGASGGGIVYKLAPDGSTFTVLHSFAGTDGALPTAGLIMDSLGNLYGTTSKGGESNLGVVFELAPNGSSYTLLYTFAGASDGANPEAGLYADAIGNLYGTTNSGGGPACPICGSVFEIHPDGFEKAIHNFLGALNDGANPAAGLIADSSGNLYGTTVNGGTSNAGTVFKLSPGGTVTVLHSFAGNSSDGAFPLAGLIADANGNLYGTASQGGAFGDGIVFSLSPAGTSYTILHAFQGNANDGSYPYGGLLADGSGNLYGTASQEGIEGGGVVYELSGTGFVPPRRVPPPAP